MQEINELRNAAIKLVTQLAQSPLSAIHFKDVLLAMPIMQRQQLQVLFLSFTWLEELLNPVCMFM